MDEDVAELLGASCVIYLLQTPAGSNPTSKSTLARNYSRHWTPVHMDFVVDDVSKAAQRALDAGAIQESECIAWNGSNASPSPIHSVMGSALSSLKGKHTVMRLTECQAQ
jgi:hypothetical protein